MNKRKKVKLPKLRIPIAPSQKVHKDKSKYNKKTERKKNRQEPLDSLEIQQFNKIISL